MENFKNRLEMDWGINRTVLALSVARMMDAVGNSILVVLIPLMVKNISPEKLPFATSVMVGILLSMFGILNTLFQPLMGILSDKTGKRKSLILIGLMIMAAGTLAFVFAESFESLMLIRAVQALGVSMTVPTSLAIMALRSNEKTRGGSMGVWTTLRLVGFSVGPLVGGFLEVHFSMPVAFITGTVLVLISVVMVQLWVEEVPPEEEEPQKIAVSLEEPDVTRQSGFWSPSLEGIGLALFAMSFALSLMASLENEYKALLNISTLDFSIAYSALTFSRLIVQFPISKYSDKIGRKPVIATGLILLIPTTILLGYGQTIFQLILIRVLQGVAVSAIGTPGMALAGDIAPKGAEGRQMSLTAVAFFLGTSIGPLLAGILVVQSFAFPFWVGGCIALLSLVAVYRLLNNPAPREQILRAD